MLSREDEIKRILDLMVDGKVPFIILRSYDFLRDKAVDTPAEIDILIPYSAYPNTRRLFFDQMYYYHSQHEVDDRLFTKFRAREIFLTFHIQFEYLRAMNMCYLPYPEALRFTSKVGSYPCLDGPGLLVHLFVHCSIERGTFKSTHRQKIQHLIVSPNVERDVSGFPRRYFPKRILNHLLHFSKEAKFEKFERKRWLYALYFLSKRPKQFKNICKYIVFKLRHKFNLSGKGLIVALIGIDGVGKTTLCRATVEVLRRFRYRTRYIYMGRVREHILPMDKVSKRIGISQTKKGQPGQLYLLSRDLVYTLDMILRYLFLIFPYKILNYIIVCDRYAYDLYLDKGQTFLSKWFLRHLYPRPDILIFLELPEEEVVRRKNEHDSKQRKLFMRRWRCVAEQFRARSLIPDDVEANTFLIYELIEKFRFEKHRLERIKENEKSECN